MLKPKARDVTTEATQFFVEASNLYLPGPGVVDGRHRLSIRASQGQVSELDVVVPNGLTVSAVGGPVGSWQFDADTGGLKLEIEPAQSKAFDIMIETQRGLDPLPADVNLAPLKVAGAGGEVGLVAVAFGPDAQPEKLEPKTMSAVNLGDFDACVDSLESRCLHRVYRYGAEGGEIACPSRSGFARKSVWSASRCFRWAMNASFWPSISPPRSPVLVCFNSAFPCQRDSKSNR